MRFLKNKIAQARSFEDAQKRSSPGEEIKREQIAQKPSILNFVPTVVSRETRSKCPCPALIPETPLATKNIVKNYGRAICNFAISGIGLPYLESMLQSEGVKLQGFTQYIFLIKQKIKGLSHFRSILLAKKKDCKETQSYKRIFKKISEVFIKYFSVNWIFHSKIIHKEAHLKFRFKMLRRIKCPELFTYLKTPKGLQKK